MAGNEHLTANNNMSITLKNKDNSNPVLVNLSPIAVVNLKIYNFYFSFGKLTSHQTKGLENLVSFSNIELDIPYFTFYSSVIVTYNYLDVEGDHFYAFNYDRASKKVFSIGADFGADKSPISGNPKEFLKTIKQLNN